MQAPYQQLGLLLANASRRATAILIHFANAITQRTDAEKVVCRRRLPGRTRPELKHGNTIEVLDLHVVRVKSGKECLPVSFEAMIRRRSRSKITNSKAPDA